MVKYLIVLLGILTLLSGCSKPKDYNEDEQNALNKFSFVIENDKSIAGTNYIMQNSTITFKIEAVSEVNGITINDIFYNVSNQTIDYYFSKLGEQTIIINSLHIGDTSYRVNKVYTYNVLSPALYKMLTFSYNRSLTDLTIDASQYVDLPVPVYLRVNSYDKDANQISLYDEIVVPSITIEVPTFSQNINLIFYLLLADGSYYELSTKVIMGIDPIDISAKQLDDATYQIKLSTNYPEINYISYQFADVIEPITSNEFRLINQSQIYNSYELIIKYSVNDTIYEKVVNLTFMLEDYESFTLDYNYVQHNMYRFWFYGLFYETIDSYVLNFYDETGLIDSITSLNSDVFWTNFSYSTTYKIEAIVNYHLPYANINKSISKTITLTTEPFEMYETPVIVDYNQVDNVVKIYSSWYYQIDQVEILLNGKLYTTDIKSQYVDLAPGEYTFTFYWSTREGSIYRPYHDVYQTWLTVYPIAPNLKVDLIAYPVGIEYKIQNVEPNAEVININWTLSIYTGNWKITGTTTEGYVAGLVPHCSYFFNVECTYYTTNTCTETYEYYVETLDLPELNYSYLVDENNLEFFLTNAVADLSIQVISLSDNSIIYTGNNNYFTCSLPVGGEYELTIKYNYYFHEKAHSFSESFTIII